MSLLGFQSAVAALIRVPEENRGMTARKFLKQFDLTTDEFNNALKLAKVKQVTLYGLEQAEQRWDSIQRHVIRVFRFAPHRVLRNIWFQLFEPLHMCHEVDNEGRLAFSIAYLDFLANDKRARKRLANKVPNYFWDVIDYERAELELSRPVLEDPVLHPASKLLHPRVRVIDVNYNIPVIIAQAMEQPGTWPDASPQKTTVLLIARGARLQPRTFVIDGPTKNYLKSQYTPDAAKPASRKVSKDLKSVGLLA